MKKFLSLALFLALAAAPAALAGETAKCEKGTKTAAADCCDPNCKPGDPKCDAEKAKMCEKHGTKDAKMDCCKGGATAAAKSTKKS